MTKICFPCQNHLCWSSVFLASRCQEQCPTCDIVHQTTFDNSEKLSTCQFYHLLGVAKKIFTTKNFPIAMNTYCMARNFRGPKFPQIGHDLTISKPRPLWPDAYSDDGKCVLYTSDGAWIPHLQKMLLLVRSYHVEESWITVRILSL